MKHGVYLIQKNKLWYGEVWLKNKLQKTTIGMTSKGNTIMRADKEARSIGIMQEQKIPSYKETQANEKKLKEAKAEKEIKQPEISKTHKSAPKQKKTAKRKPYTPYGLKGYFVDNNGNVRLNLDRKCNAQTITLNATFFNQLADMVKTTLANE